MTNEQLFLDIVEYTNQSMLYELFTYPSFGKVSIYSKGAHDDMDHYTFVDSISVLNKYMYQFAKIGYSDLTINEMYRKAVEIGIKCEKAMFLKTKGINTHKGLIFVLGTLVCSTMKALYQNDNFEKIFHYVRLITKPKIDELSHLVTKNDLSHGEKIYLEYNIEGVRKEAYLGFPIIQETLKILNINDKSTHVLALIYIMSKCDDTTILHRIGLDGLREVKKVMSDLYEKGYDIDTLEQVKKDFIKKNVSPGGSADLLCGTFFLLLVKNKFTQGVVNNEW